VRRRFAVLVAVAVALAGLWFVALWRPQTARLDDARQRQVAASTEVTTLEAKLADLRKVAGDGSKLDLEGSLLRAAMPDDPQLALLLLQANDAAIRSGVQYLTVTPTEPAPSAVPGAATEIKVSIDVTGRYTQLLDFLDRLAALPRAVVVDTVSVTPEGQGPAPVLRASISGRAFTAQGSAPATAPDPEAAP
jgi:Tfp pilus assembly protein PilO